MRRSVTESLLLVTMLYFVMPNELAQWAAKPSAGATSWAVGGDARYGR